MDEEFRRFAEDVVPQLLRVARRITGDVDQAEDLVQESLLRVALSWSRVQRKGGFEDPDRYAVVTLVNCWRSWQRRAWRRLERSTSDLQSYPTTPTTDTAASDELAWLLGELPPRQRAILVLRFYLDYSERQTADALGCSVGTVKSQTSRGLERLRSLMASMEKRP